MGSSYKLDKDAFSRRLKRLYDLWKVCKIWSLEPNRFVDNFRRPKQPVPGADAPLTNRMFGSQEPDDLCEGGFKDMDALVVPVGGTDDIVYSKSTSLQVRELNLFSNRVLPKL